MRRRRYIQPKQKDGCLLTLMKWWFILNVLPVILIYLTVFIVGLFKK